MPISVAVILPCYNEADVIQGVVKDFQSHLPDATIYVIDNNSTDNTGDCARNAGAYVIVEKLKGKGNAVRRAFSDVEADVFIMADGDGTYDASRAPELINLLVSNNLDMVVGTRETDSKEAYRSGHRIGNKSFNMLLRYMFGDRFTDIFSGYRVFSRRFVKSFPALSAGFEIETELSVHAIQMGSPTQEVETRYFDREEGSESKLRTYRDGFRILLTMLKLMKHMRPMYMFSTIALLLAILSLGIGLPVVASYMETGLVDRIPTTVAAAGLMVLSAITLVSGLILDSISFSLRNTKRLAYLALGPAISLGSTGNVSGD